MILKVDISEGTSRGYEIKSDCDTLRRLPNQVDAYGKILDRATLVVGQRHLLEPLGKVPTWWGILKVEATANGTRLKELRPGRKNPAKTPG